MTEQISDRERPATDDFRWNLLQKKIQTLRVNKAFSLFRANFIEPILIKGWAAARAYPDAKFRNSIDIDLAVSSADFKSASAICRLAAADGLAIDLHRELRHLDTVEWADLFANSCLIETSEASVRLLRPEDHLRVLCVHWLTDGGAHKDRLWDIYYAVANRGSDFDWDRCLNSVSIRRRRWITCTLGLAHRYLGLDLDDTPVKHEAIDLPAWLVETVEKEWTSENRLLPLDASLGDAKVLAKQLGKRFHPNPIWATVHMNGSFDAKTRLFYQLGSWFKRIGPSIRRVSRAAYLMRTK